MDEITLAFTPAVEMARLVRARELSPREIVETVLRRIERINPLINAYCTVVPDLALVAAKRAEEAVTRGEPLGPLHGVPVSIKDITATAGIRTTFGSRLFADNVPAEDALIVARLKQAGAIVLGKTNTPEFAHGGYTDNALFGPTRNPWNTARTPGGSSGGAAAALAAGLGPLAEGSDHGGSLRGPASYCGVVGFRTSVGRVPRYPNGWLYEQFSVSGPMARTVADCALMLSVIAGPDPRVPIAVAEPGEQFSPVAHPDLVAGDVKGLRVAWSRDLGFARVDADVLAVFDRVPSIWESLGCVVEEAHPDLSDAPEIIPPLRAWRTAITSEHLFPVADRLDNPFLKQFLERGRSLSMMEVAAAEGRRSRLWERVARFFERYDLLVLPTMSTVAFPVEQHRPSTIGGQPVTDQLESSRLTYSISMTGCPSMSIPCGFTPEGLPVGMQVVGPRLHEARVIRAAAAFERAAPWAHLRPPLAEGS